LERIGGQAMTNVKDDVIERFGVDPDLVGNRKRGWWIVYKIEDEEEDAEAKIGDLCVKARDGGNNPIDEAATKHVNYIGTAEDVFDWTFRYYYYRELPPENRHSTAKGQ